MDLLNEPEHNYKSGYIKIYRSIKNHWIYEKKRKRTKLEAWYDLLLKACHTTLKEPIGYDLITVNRGQILTSQEKLSIDWKWDRSAVRSFLNSLHLDQMLTIETTNKYTMITICNYDTYQDYRPTEQQQNHQQTNTTSTHISNYNELNTLESIYMSEISDEIHTPTKRLNKWVETFDLRKEEFKNQLRPFIKTNTNLNGIYPTEMVKKFFEYWSEPNKSKSKMKFELEKTWDLSKRLIRWSNNNFDKSSTQQQQVLAVTNPAQPIDHRNR